MIGKLKGVIDSYGEDHVILDVQGVGYVVQCSARTLQRLPQPGEAAALSASACIAPEMPAPMTTTSACVSPLISCRGKRGGRLRCQTERPVRRSLVFVSTVSSPASPVENA